MKRKSAALIFLLALASLGSFALAEEHWAYKGHGGPGEWGALNVEFGACKFGRLQSPIDIRGAKTADLTPIKFDYKPSVLKIIDNGHTVQINYASGSSIEVSGVRYELLQFHFHLPSEEKVEGKSHAMVAHLVHRNADGKLAVVAVLLDKGGSSEMIDTLWKNIPAEKGKEREVGDLMIDATRLLPDNKAYYTYQGSLTTPPCSEGVTWFVLKIPTKISAGDIEAFRKLYPLNARPVQPLNGRVVQTTP
jgi:carbonic anhydrase